MKPYKSLIGTVAAACASLAFCTAQAEPAWPTTPSPWWCPSRPAAAATLARLMAEPLGRELGQTIIVENRPGAGGNIGTSIAARANPDGYTLAYGTNGAGHQSLALQRVLATRRATSSQCRASPSSPRPWW